MSRHRGKKGAGGREEEHYLCGYSKKTEVGAFFTHWKQQFSGHQLWDQEKVRDCSEEESEKAKQEIEKQS